MIFVVVGVFSIELSYEIWNTLRPHPHLSEAVSLRLAAQFTCTEWGMLNSNWIAIEPKLQLQAAVQTWRYVIPLKIPTFERPKLNVFIWLSCIKKQAMQLQSMHMKNSLSNSFVCTVVSGIYGFGCFYYCFCLLMTDDWLKTGYVCMGGY